jgi:cysteine-rich repeat protein
MPFRTPATLLLVVIVALPASAQEGARLVRCQEQIASASSRYLSKRRQVLAHCLGKALRCPGVLTGAGDGACVAAVGSRCRARLAVLTRPGVRLEQAGARCVAPPAGVSTSAFFGDDGLAFEALSAYCPHMRMRQAEPADTGVCQRWAIACSDDSALVAAVPRAGALLLRLGVQLDEGARCLMASLCGNGEVDGEEECDEGFANSDVAPDACRTTCVEAACGDGVIDDGEDCDDGNVADGDGCSAECSFDDGVCGNGLLESDEDCDDGNFLDDDGCDTDCSFSADVCGNLVVEAGEECDDGNRSAGDGCEPDCTVTEDVCGNGRVDRDEECDDGLRNSNVLPDRCRTDCVAPACGDRVIDAGHGEQCEPPATLLCAPDCRLRFPAGLPAGAGDDLTRCQAAILKTGAGLYARTRAHVERCVLGVARCLLGMPEGNGQDRCLAKADARCAAMVRKRAVLLAGAVAGATRRCASAAGALARVLDPAAGLGFVQAAAQCPLAGTGTPGLVDVLACAYGRVQCGAENVVARTVPRAYDLLWETSVDPDADFPCVTDPDLE